MAASFINWIQYKAQKNDTVRFMLGWNGLKEAIQSYAKGDPLITQKIENGKSFQKRNQDERFKLELSKYSRKYFLILKAEYEEFYAIHGFIDYDAFDFLINEFRKHFPKENRIPDATYYDDLIEKLILEYEANEGGKRNKDPENPHPEIFVDSKCWQLFEHLKDTIDQGNELAYFSYYYKKMKKDGFIFKHIGNKDFYLWLNFKYNLDLDRLLNPLFDKDKDAIYSTSKLLIKLQTLK